MSEISTANCLCWIPVLCSLNIKWLLLLLLPFTVQHQCVEGSDIICGVCCSRAHCGGVATRKKKVVEVEIVSMVQGWGDTGGREKFGRRVTVFSGS